MDAATLAGFDRIVTLPTGERLRLRPIRPDDAPRLSDLYDRLSRQSAYQRFFTVMRRLPPDWSTLLATVDYQRRFALVLDDLTAGDGRLIAVARYEPAPEPDVVEIALVVQDGWQGKGLGSLLLSELLQAAARNGLRRFRAYVLADNRRMLHVLARHTDVQERRLQGSVVELLLSAKR
jgi:RimJ/RimL family protein N-acetyltransferase